MIAGMAVGGVLCVVLGVLPFVATSAIASAFGSEPGAGQPLLAVRSARRGLHRRRPRGP